MRILVHNQTKEAHKIFHACKEGESYAGVVRRTWHVRAKSNTRVTMALKQTEISSNARYTVYGSQRPTNALHILYVVFNLWLTCNVNCIKLTLAILIT